MASLRWSQAADHALVLAARVVNDDLDWVAALGGAFRGRAASARKLGQLGAEVVVDGLVEAHPDQAALSLSQTETFVEADRDMHASADQPA